MHRHDTKNVNIEMLFVKIVKKKTKLGVRKNQWR